MANTVNKELLKTILRKRQNSEQLNNEEEAYSRQIFSDLMGSKKQVRKVVRIVTGEQLRKESKLEKSKTDAEATRKDPRYPEGKNPVSIKGENTDPDVDSLKIKIPDADIKPKTGPHPGLEQDRVSSMTQEAVPPRSEATSKFTSADPVKAGDIVSKNMMREGTRVIKGVVLKVKDDVAFVKWADGRTMTELTHLLVKVKKSEAAAAASEVKEDPKLGPSEAEEEDYNPPMTKAMSRGELAESKQLAERLKGKEDIDNPHALARWMVQRGKKFSKQAIAEGVEALQKNGDIAAAKDYSTPGASSRMQTTPFEDLTSSLQRVVDLASLLKEKQENTDDQDIKNHYDELIGKLREIAEMILSGLSMELSEAEAEADNE